MIRIVSEDATSQVASTCLQIEYDCIVFVLVCFVLVVTSSGGGVGLLVRSSACLRARAGRCEFHSWSLSEGEKRRECKSITGVSLFSRYVFFLFSTKLQARALDLHASGRSVTTVHNISRRGGGFGEYVNEETALAKPWTLISLSLRVSIVFKPAVSLCACAHLTARVRLPLVV